MAHIKCFLSLYIVRARGEAPILFERGRRPSREPLNKLEAADNVFFSTRFARSKDICDRRFSERAQISMEYIIIFVVILAAILSKGIIDKSRGSFKKYLTKANATMTTLTPGGVAWAPTGRSKAGGGDVAVAPGIPGAGEGTDYDPNDADAAKQAALSAKEKVRADLQRRYDAAKIKYDSLYKEYTEKKAVYDAWKAALDWFNLWPKYDDTRNGSILKIQVDAYKTMTDGLSNSLTALGASAE